MKDILLVILLYLVVIFNSQVQGQNSFYKQIELGQNSVGYYDTLLFNNTLSYNQYGYQGSSPIFIQIWFPLNKQPSSAPLQLNDFNSLSLSYPLKNIYEQLKIEKDKSFITYNLIEDFPNYNPINYGKFTHLEVLEEIRTFQTISHKSKLSKIYDSPVIVYHHGTQGFSEENFVMGEYFASKGYLFVSANYHLPFKDKPYGLQESVSNNTSSETAVINLAKSFTTSDNVFYVGHSWGAQVGWYLLPNNLKVKAFVSMETTIEFKSDSSEIKDKWPFVYNSIITNRNQLNIPVLMFANTGINEPFSFFKNANLNQTFFVSAKQEFGHESYTACNLLRSFFTHKFKQPDSLAMKTQVYLYLKNLHIMEEFFSSILNNTPFPKEICKDDYFIN